jgi:hypothetical protein
MTLPTNFWSSPETGHWRYCDWTARFAPLATFTARIQKRLGRLESGPLGHGCEAADAPFEVVGAARQTFPARSI